MIMQQEREMKLDQLIEQAKSILDGNWPGQSTKPSPHMYPHQWNWDSGLIAIGYARYHQKPAQQKLFTLFAAQWDYWINTHWLLLQGLRRYGFQEKTENVKRDIITRIEGCGFHEYFNPYQDFGCGTDNFSWTAAIFIDIALEKVEAGTH